MMAERRLWQRIPTAGWCAIAILATLVVTERPAPALAQVIDARVQRQEMIAELKQLNAQAKQTNLLLADLKTAFEKK